MSEPSRWYGTSDDALDRHNDAEFARTDGTRCVCGAAAEHHHAVSVVESGCVVTPRVGHSCPCPGFVPPVETGDTEK